MSFSDYDLVRKLDEMQREIDALKIRETPFPVWTAWTPTPTGWSGTPTLDCRRLVIGEGVWFRVYASGTSNLTTATLTLPFTAANVFGWGGACNYVLDAGTAPATPARWTIDYGSGSIVFYKTFAGAGWTASGNKLIMANGFFQIP